jgi:hypothetical protein
MNRAVSSAVSIGRLHLVASVCTWAVLFPLSASAQTMPDTSDSPIVGEPLPAIVAPAPPPPAPAPGNPQPVASVINAQVGTRMAVRLQNPTVNQHDKVNDVGSDGEAEVVLRGQVHPFLRWQVGVLGRYGDPNTTTAAELLDAIAKIELAGPLNLWIGRMPMASDRASLGTEWSNATWTMPGTYSFYTPAVTGPRYGKNGRGDGATLWGQMGGGTFKYYVGAFGLSEPSTSPLYTGRLSLSLLNPEPGFGTSSTYYGTKDVLALGVGVQHRSRDRQLPANSLLALPADFNALTADVLFEKNGGAAGVLNVEGGFTKLWPDGELVSYQTFGLVSYLLPIEVGIGRFQPLVRVQYAGKGKAIGATDFTGADAQLGYIIDGLNARLLGSYQYSKMQGQTENAVLFGLQLLSHAR